MKPEANQALLDEVEELLQREGRMSGAAAFRALGPTITYVQFMARYFSPTYEAIFGEPPGKRGLSRGRREPRESKIPLRRPEPVEIPPPVLRLKPQAFVRLREDAAKRGMESGAGRFTSEPVEGGGYRISLELSQADRSTHLFLTGFVQSVLFPEVGE